MESQIESDRQIDLLAVFDSSAHTRKKLSCGEYIIAYTT